MNLLFNKPFLDNVTGVFDSVFKQTHMVGQEDQCTVYVDAANGDTTDTRAVEYIVFAPQSFVNILEKIDNALWNELVQEADLPRIKILLNTIISGSEVQRNSAFTKLVQMGIVLEADTTMSRTLVSRVDGFDPSLLIQTYDETEGFYKYSYNIPMGLDKSYDSVRNTGSEKLYLVFPSRIAAQFGAQSEEGKQVGYIQTFRNQVFQVNSRGISFGAVELSDLSDPENTDVKYDHIDKIEYFDNLVFQIQVPNKFN